jgi:hypothetical protein
VTGRLGSGFDVALGLIMTLGLSFAAFGLGSRFISPMVGGLVAVGVFLSMLAWTLAGQLRDRRFTALAAGRCPRCGSELRTEHRHRRWEPALRAWLAPATSWDCDACSYGHTEAWTCADCPE